MEKSTWWEEAEFLPTLKKSVTVWRATVRQTCKRQRLSGETRGKRKGLPLQSLVRFTPRVFVFFTQQKNYENAQKYIRRSYIKALRVPSPYLVRICNSSIISKDRTIAKTQIWSFFLGRQEMLQQRKNSRWPDNAAITLLSNFLSAEVKRSPQTIYVCLQSQLGESQNAGTYLGNTSSGKPSFIPPAAAAASLV